MSDHGLLRGAVKEYLDMLRVNTQADGPNAAKDELLKLFEKRDPATMNLLFVTALEMLAERPARRGITQIVSPAQLQGQLDVHELCILYRGGRRKLDPGSALTELERNFAEGDPTDNARLLAAAIHTVTIMQEVQ